jgi:CRP/FNR family cyclic AMP-dependent transcriptional regulator
MLLHRNVEKRWADTHRFSASEHRDGEENQGAKMSLAAVTILKNMSGEHLRRLELGGTILEPRDGTTLFAQGDPADAVFAIIAGDGHIRVGSVDRHSKALMVEVFRTGEIFGEIGVIDGGSRTAAAVTEGKVRLLKIRGAAFLAALATSPELGDALCRMMARRLRRTFELFQDATFNTMEARLARQILYLSSRGGRQTPQGIRLADRLRQGDLADLLGTTTRSIITTLNAWRAAGLVLYDTDRALLTVCDVARLQSIVEPDRA